MLTVKTYLKRLLPNGTTPDAKSDDEKWQQFPTWPPDLFAVAASLIDRSGFYSHPRYAGDVWADVCYDKGYVDSIMNVAKDWARFSEGSTRGNVDTSISVGRSLTQLSKSWQALMGCDDLIEDCASAETLPDWCDDAIRLMAIADEASAGLGFIRDRKDANEFNAGFIDFWIDQYIIKDLVIFIGYMRDTGLGKLGADERESVISTINTIFNGKAKEYLDLIDNIDALHNKLTANLKIPRVTNSLCILVPTSEACVHPKTRTSAVGCTLRSLSHHLALLPPISQVETIWRAQQGTSKSASQQRSSALNLLLVPFPYKITANSFVRGNPCLGSYPARWDEDGSNRAQFFSVDQTWLSDLDSGDGKVSAEKIASFLRALIEEAQKEIKEIHGVILPELALNGDLAEQVALELKKVDGLEFFITGILANPLRMGRGPRNSVYTAVFSSWGFRSWEQAKHHRWKLDHHQIRRYHLGGRLDPHVDWWEHIDLHPRRCFFGSFRPEASLAALVCEDLARIDPVQTAIRSIGPNLVVALLMDGPQMEGRWPGRYATVLADDPGCAVLTLTSLGLIKRSFNASDKNTYRIALWKEAGGDKATELEIPTDHHALILTISHKKDNAYTLDGRADLPKTVSFARSGYQALKLEKLPGWLA